MLCLPAMYVERVNVIEGPCGGPVPLRDAWTGFCHSATTQRCHCSRSCQFAVNYVYTYLCIPYIISRTKLARIAIALITQI